MAWKGQILYIKTPKKGPHVHVVKEALWACNLSICFDEEEDFSTRRESNLESTDLLLSGPRHDQGVQ